MRYDKSSNQVSQALPQAHQAQKQASPSQLQKEDGTTGQMTQPDIFTAITAIQVIADLDIRDANSDDPEGIVLVALRNAFTEGERAGMERAAVIAENKYPLGSAHTYASENADIYRAQEHAAAHIATAIRAAKETTE